jgi:site-specific recombinase
MAKQIDKTAVLDRLFKKKLSASAEEDEVDFLRDIVGTFRPSDPKKIQSVDITPLLQLLHTNQEYTNFLRTYLFQLMRGKDFDQIIYDAGIIKDSDFLYEVRKRIIEKVIPYQPEKNTLQYVLNQAFYVSTDPLWLEKIPSEQLLELFEVCGFESLYEPAVNNFAFAEILYGLEVLVQRISGRAMETDVNKMVPEFQNFESPFIALQREFSDFNDRLLSSEKKYIASDDLNYKQLQILLKQCDDYVRTAFQNTLKYGISMKVNQTLLRIRQQLDRIKELLPFVILEDESESKQKTIDVSLELIKLNCYKSNIKQLVSDSTQSISYEITQHSANTGENYITSTSKEYWKMFRTACGGGFIVAFLCIFKVLLSKVDTSEFGSAFLYSMNYSLGFIAIYLTGGTLATKQPAMTASALVSALVKGTNEKTGIEDRYYSFAIFFARVFRSQFIAFMGNVLFAFPMAMLLIWGIDVLFHYNIAATKWETLLTDLDPIASKAILHAAIAGFFLFISGIIAGSIANRNKHFSVYYRIQEHPILKKTFGKKKTLKIADKYNKYYAGITSNFWFGIFMGSTASIGVFLGLDLDIRHITFASGNLALGLYGGNFDVDQSLIVWGVIGIGVIGLVNFLVSFSLSTVLAFRSRNIPLSELRLVAGTIWRYFLIQPAHFFYPPKQSSKASNQNS